MSPDGKRIRRKVRARTKAQVIAKLDAMKADVRSATPVVDGRRTTADYLRWWLGDVLPGTVKGSTAIDYAWVVEHYVIPYVGTVPLAKLAPSHVQRMLRSLEDQGKSPRTRQYARAVLRRALAYAQRWDLVSRNSAALVDGPRNIGTHLDDTMTLQQAKAVVAAASGDPYEAIAVLVLRLGLRRGEALALRWQDVDLDSGELHIRGTLKRVSGVGLVRDLPKTTASQRTLPLPETCLDALHQRRAIQTSELAALPAHQPSGFVFTTPLDTAIDPRNLSRWWDRLCAKAGIGHHRFHSTRHTAATLLLDEGIPLEIVSAILGHASISITADVYAKVTSDAKRRALTRLQL